MASPQLEDGHTQIANEILDQLAKLYLSPNQWQVVIFIIRKTYGYRKKVDYIANSQIIEGTGLSKAVVSRVLKKLEKWNIIDRNKKHIGFQKDWEQWKLAEQSTELTKQSTKESCLNGQPELAEQSTELTKQSTKVDSPRVTQKKKETIQKKLYKRNYGEFNNTLLSDEEYQKLVVRFGEKETVEKIEGLSLGIASKGYKYKNHYATILAWEKRDQKGGQSGVNQRNPRQLPAREDYAEPY